MKTFVGIITEGTLEDFREENVYAGNDLHAALNAIRTYKFEAGTIGSGYIEHWEDGKLITTNLEF